VLPVCALAKPEPWPCWGHSLFVHNACGFRHHELCPQVADLLGTDYSTHQLSYDLRRLRLKGMLWRVPNSHRYLITPYGCKVALFFTRLHASVFRPGFAALDPSVPIPDPLSEALFAVEREVKNLVDQAHVAP
jgi:hypothetical protein